MDSREFERWYAIHRASYPGLDTWLAGLSDRRPPIDPQDTLRAWRGVLKHVSFAGAKAATEAMLSGDLEEPRGFERHPGAIRRYAQEFDGRTGGGRANRRGPMGGKIVGGEVVYDCPRCEDSGMRTVWHSQTVQAVRDQAEKVICYSAAVGCECDRGKRLTAKTPLLGTFDAARDFLRADYPDLERLRAAVMERDSDPATVAARFGAAEF